MYVLRMLLMVVEVLVCLMIIGLVLIQRSKGDGLNAAIGGGGMGEALFGAHVGNVLTRATVILGIVFLVNTIALGLLSPSTSARVGGSVMDNVPTGTAAPPPAMPGVTPFSPGAEDAAPVPAAPATPETPAPVAPPATPAPVVPPVATPAPATP